MSRSSALTRSSSWSRSSSPVTTSASITRTPAISRARNSVSAWVRSATCAVDLPLGAVPPLLAVLGEQDQRCRVRGLQRQDEGQQDETAVPRVELEAFGEQQVVGDPEADDDRLPHEEPGGAEEAGDRLGETAEHVRLVLDPMRRLPRGSVRSSRRFTMSSRCRSWCHAVLVRKVTPRWRQPTPSWRSSTSSTVTAPSRCPASSQTATASMS